MTKYLNRQDAPLGEAVWSQLDAIMVAAAKSVLAGRRLLPLEGPFGLGLKSVPLPDAAVQEGVRVSRSIPLALIQTGFRLSASDLAAYERDRVALDLGSLASATIQCARLEDHIVFHGLAGAPGLVTAEGAVNRALAPWDLPGVAAGDLIGAVSRLDEAGFHGPYKLALAPARYNLLLRQYPDSGGMELEHITRIASAGVVKAPVLKDGGVLLASGAPFVRLVLGQDMSVGFVARTGDALEFSVSESLAVMIGEPAAICVLQA